MWARSCVACAAAALCTRALGAQQRPVSPRRDTIPAVVSDSAARDSAVTRILDQDSARTVRPAAFSLLGLDRLRLRTVGVSYGMAWPGQAVPTNVYALQAEYGEIGRGVRVVFVSSYWATRYQDAEVARLAREVASTVHGGSAVDTVQLGHIRVADLSGGVEARWEPGLARQAHALLRVIRPWAGGGMSAHFVNVEGPPVSGTFLERALDAVAIGLSGGVGVDVSPLPNIQATMQARYDFLSTVRYGSLRAGASFVFGPLGGEGRPR
jgi:hypothetical protein